MPARRTKRLQVTEHSVSVSNPDKLLFPESGITKEEYVAYYRAVAPYMLPHIKGRPISMERFPDGIGGERFFQKDAPDYFPEFVRRVEVASDGGATKQYAVAENEATIVYLANLVTIPHIWMSRVESLRLPDRVVWDLDPMGLTFEQVVIGAKLLRFLLSELGTESYPMLTGSRGLHIVVFLRPAYDASIVFQFAKDVARLIARKLPKVFTVTFAKSRRGKKIYVDTHRNVYAQTAVAPYSVRAIEGAPVALPFRWEEVESGQLQARQYRIKNTLARLEKEGDSWSDVTILEEIKPMHERVKELLSATRIVGS